MTRIAVQTWIMRGLDAHKCRCGHSHWDHTWPGGMHISCRMMRCKCVQFVPNAPTVTIEAAK